MRKKEGMSEKEFGGRVLWVFVIGVFLAGATGKVSVLCLSSHSTLSAPGGSGCFLASRKPKCN